ncbi:flippase-like domain-containing protein [bacterium]|nr:flippase-like domain-containing protein [bacterium]
MEKRNLLLNLVKVLVTVYIIYFLLKKTPLESIINSFARIRLLFFGIAFLIGLLFTLLKIYKWHLLVKDLDPSISISSSIDGYLSGMALGVVTPGRVGEVGRIVGIPSDKKFAGLGLVLWDKVFDLLVVVLLSLWGIWYFLGHYILVIVALVLIGILFLVIQPKYLEILLKFPIVKRYSQLLEGLRHLKMKTILICLSLTLVSYNLVLFEALFLLRAFGYGFNLGIFIAYPLVMLANLIPITVGGLGVREGFSILLLSRFGILDTVAFNLAFLIFLINTALPAVWGLFPINRSLINNKLILIFITALGGFVRFYNIGSRSLWLDEAITVNLAWSSIKDIILNRASTGIHPPLYFILIRIWILIFGDSEMALRSFSAIFSTISIPIIYLFTSRVFDPAIAVISSLLFALSPFQLYYSQEARMYPLLTFLFILSLYLLYRWSIGECKSEKRTLLGIIFINVISLYTHIYTVFLILLQNLYIFWVKFKERKVLKRWILYQIIIAVAFLPWIYVIIENRTPEVYQGKQNLSLEVIKNSFLEINLGYARSIFSRGNLPNYLFLFFLTLFLFGLLPPYREKKGFALVCLYISIPFLLLVLFSLEKSFFSARYLSPFIVGYFILLARGIRRLKLYPIVILALLVVLGVDTLAIYNYNNRFDFISRPWRKLVDYIHSNALDGDVVLITAPQMYRPFIYYDRGRLPYVIIDGFGNVPVDIYRGTYSYKRVWFIMAGEDSSDPNGKIKNWLDSNYKRIDGIEFYRLKTYLYEIPQEFNSVNVIFSNPSSDYIEYTVEIRYPKGELRDVLETFDRLGLKGTFFFTAEAIVPHKDIVKEMITKGYQIGLLGEYYIDYTTYPKEYMVSSLKRAEEILEDIIEKEVRIFRPPQSRFNKELLTVIYELGYTIKFWDVDIRRWNHYDTDFALRKLQPFLSPGRVVNLGIWDNFSKSILQSYSMDASISSSSSLSK